MLQSRYLQSISSANLYWYCAQIWTDAKLQIDLIGSTAALQNVPNSTVITIRLYGWGATMTTGTFALGRLAGNDLAIGGTVVSSNSIAIPTVTGSPFSLANCAATASGTIDFTSIGTFSASTFNAELSDALFNVVLHSGFGTTVANWTVNPSGTINITIPELERYQALCIKLELPVPVRQYSVPFFDVTGQPGFGIEISTADYYRSGSSGNWNDPTTWESSP